MLFIFFFVVGFLILNIMFVIEIVGVGILSVKLLSFFLRCGRISVIVFAVLVVVGIIESAAVFVFFKFLCGRFKICWLFVYECIVVIRFFFILKCLLIIFVIGVK